MAENVLIEQQIKDQKDKNQELKSYVDEFGIIKEQNEKLINILK